MPPHASRFSLIFFAILLELGGLPSRAFAMCANGELSDSGYAIATDTRIIVDATAFEETMGATIYAVYNASGTECDGDYCVWGNDGGGRAFCYEHRLVGTETRLVVRGTDFADFIYFQDGAAADLDIYGTTAFVGSAAGLDGDDFIEGSRSEKVGYMDELKGDDGDDIVYGGAGIDRVFGGGGDDALYGEDGVDLVCGDEDDDAIDAGGDGDTIDAGPGNDSVTGTDAADIVDVGEGDADLLEGVAVRK